MARKIVKGGNGGSGGRNGKAAKRNNEREEDNDGDNRPRKQQKASGSGADHIAASEALVQLNSPCVSQNNTPTAVTDGRFFASLPVSSLPPSPFPGSPSDHCVGLHLVSDPLSDVPLEHHVAASTSTSSETHSVVKTFTQVVDDTIARKKENDEDFARMLQALKDKAESRDKEEAENRTRMETIQETATVFRNKYEELKLQHETQQEELKIKEAELQKRIDDARAQGNEEQRTLLEPRLLQAKSDLALLEENRAKQYDEYFSSWNDKFIQLGHEYAEAYVQVRQYKITRESVLALKSKRETLSASRIEAFNNARDKQVREEEESLTQDLAVLAKVLEEWQEDADLTQEQEEEGENWATRTVFTEFTNDGSLHSIARTSPQTEENSVGYQAWAKKDRSAQYIEILSFLKDKGMDITRVEGCRAFVNDADFHKRNGNEITTQPKKMLQSFLYERFRVRVSSNPKDGDGELSQNDPVFGLVLKTISRNLNSLLKDPNTPYSRVRAQVLA